MRPSPPTALVLLLLVAAGSSGTSSTAARTKKKCKPLCRTTIATCIESECQALRKGPKSRCKARCKRNTLAACRADPDLTQCVSSIITPSDHATVTGRVVRTDLDTQSGAPVPGARVRATVDSDGSGGVGAGESIETTTADDGSYSLDVPIGGGRTTVVRFEASGFAPLLRTLHPGPDAVIRLNANLRAMGALDCSGGKCIGPGDGLSVFGLSADLAGSGQAFDPTTQADAGPGASEDVAGRLLHSTVFGVVQLTDTAGNPVTMLSQPATLCFAIPADSRASVVDVVPGSGAIEMPLFAFDEVQGAWVEDGQAVLQTTDGAAIAEANLASVRDGTLPGPIQACGLVSHFSWWNVASVVDQVACLALDVRDAAGNPATGAAVSFIGSTYPAASGLMAVGDDGAVCTEVPRSEGADEDIDGDGVYGEQDRTRIRVWFADKVYDGGEFVDEAQAGMCPCSSQTIQLDPSRELGSRICTVTGRVVDAAGLPQSGFEVVGFDPGVTDDELVSTCSVQTCTFVGLTDADGNFALGVPVLEDLELFAIGTQTPLSGDLAIPACPSAPVEIVVSPDAVS